MHTIVGVLVAHPFWSGVVSFWIFSAAVSALPPPNGSGKGYKWLYAFLNKVAANIFNAFGSKIPGVGAPPSK